MCPFKPLSELVLKCDTGINLSESCCGGVEPPLMEIFGRAAISFQALGQSGSSGWIPNAQRFLGDGGGYLEGMGVHGAAALLRSQSGINNAARGEILDIQTQVFLLYLPGTLIYRKISCLRWHCNNCPRYRRTASACSYAANRINLSIPERRLVSWITPC